MSFRVAGLSPEPFRHLFGLPDDELARQGVHRFVADSQSKFPDRIELRDVAPGESVLLLNYLHQPADSPYRASHAIFVREGAQEARVTVDEVPEALRTRPLSLRAFDDRGMIVGAELADGPEMAEAVERLLADERVDYVHAHFARQGCYAARIDRLETGPKAGRPSEATT
jgi:hypothetical protein